jgi:hypothetical protein
MSTVSTTIAAPLKSQQANPRGGGGGATRTILIKDMDPTRDKVYNGCLIYGTIIDLPAAMVSLITGSPSSVFQHTCIVIVCYGVLLTLSFFLSL